MYNLEIKQDRKNSQSVSAVDDRAGKRNAKDWGVVDNRPGFVLQGRLKDAIQLAVIQCSSLSDILKDAFEQGGITLLCDLIDQRHDDYHADKEVHALLKECLDEKGLWLAMRHLLYGAEADWPWGIRIEKEIRGITNLTNWGEVIRLLSFMVVDDFDAMITGLMEDSFMGFARGLIFGNPQDFDVIMGKMNRDQTVLFLDKIEGLLNWPGFGGLKEKVKVSRVLSVAGAGIGGFHWRGGSSSDIHDHFQVKKSVTRGGVTFNNDFAIWIRSGLAQTPGRDSTMNCWETVLFMAFQAGVASKEFLVGIHTKAAQAAEKANDQQVYFTTLQDSMTGGPINTWVYNPHPPGAPLIPAGNIVFLNDLQHVVISRGTLDGQGRQEVFSMWIYPLRVPEGASNSGFMQLTTLEELFLHMAAPRTVTFSAPPW